MKTIVVGGGPAGLFAAELLSSSGIEVHLFDRMPSVGRKFLVAGSSGLNLTNALEPSDFPKRYTGPKTFWHDALSKFGPEDLRKWAAGLGIETYIGTSGKVFPVGQQAAPLLRRWVSRLRANGVVFHPKHRWIGLEKNSTGGWRLQFQTPDEQTHFHEASSVILALGGASWPQTGSDGKWTAILSAKGIPITPLTSANGGFNVAWPAEVIEKAAGLPLKNIAATSGTRTIRGECMITKHGIEGGVIYPLGPEIRETSLLTLDLKPDSTASQLIDKLRNPKGALLSTARRRWNLSEAAVALLGARGAWKDPGALAAQAKHFQLEVRGTRPIEEAISSAGGVAWEALDESLRIRKMPGVFVAGEMIDWEAPTGGFLLQGAFATGMRAAEGVLNRDTKDGQENRQL